MSLIKSKTRGSLIVLSGPSGVGKDTVVSEYIKNMTTLGYQYQLHHVQ